MVGHAVSREETDFAGPPGQPPEAAIDMIRREIGEVDLHPVAQLVTDRHTVDLVAGDTRRAEVADDRVSVRSGSSVVETFREVEVELFDADDALIDAVMARLASGRSGEPESTPKYVRALRALGQRSRRTVLSEPPTRRDVARLTRAALPSVGPAPSAPSPWLATPLNCGPWASILTMPTRADESDLRRASPIFTVR